MRTNVISPDRSQSREGLVFLAWVCDHEPVESARLRASGYRRLFIGREWVHNCSLQRPGPIKCMARSRAMQIGKPASAPEALRPAAELGR
jgi:hypothetical protein